MIGSMLARRLPNGNLLVPRTATGPDGIEGDAMVEISPNDPAWTEAYADWERSRDYEDLGSAPQQQPIQSR